MKLKVGKKNALEWDWLFGKMVLPQPHKGNPKIPC
jgi:hypothetical protein